MTAIAINDLSLSYTSVSQEFISYGDKWAQQWRAQLQDKLSHLHRTLQSLPFTLDQSDRFPNLKNLSELKAKVIEVKIIFDKSHNRWYSMIWEPEIDKITSKLLGEIHHRMKQAAQIETLKINSWAKKQLDITGKEIYGKWEETQTTFKDGIAQAEHELHKHLPSQLHKNINHLLETAKTSPRHEVPKFFLKYSEWTDRLCAQGERMIWLTNQKNQEHLQIGQDQEIFNMCEVMGRLNTWNALVQSEQDIIRDDLDTWNRECGEILKSISLSYRDLKNNLSDKKQQKLIENLTSLLVEREKVNMRVIEQLYQRFQEMLARILGVIAQLALALNDDSCLNNRINS